MRVILALAVLILGSTGGEIAITYGMKATGEPARLRPRALLIFLGRAVRNGWFWVGVPLMALSFYSLAGIAFLEAHQFCDSRVRAELRGRHAGRQVHSG